MLEGKNIVRLGHLDCRSKAFQDGIDTVIQLVSVDLRVLAGESMGWQPLKGGAYIHQCGDFDSEAAQVVYVVGVPDIAFAGLNVLLLT
jgi:hypothetical protein